MKKNTSKKPKPKVFKEPKNYRESFVPLSPLIMESTLNFYRSENGELVYAEIRRNEAENKRFVPLEKGELELLVKNLSKENKYAFYDHLSSAMPDNLIRFDFIEFKDIAWICPAGLKTFSVQDNGENPRLVKMILPAMYFRYSNNSVMTQLFIGPDFKTTKKVFATPMLNTTINGSVCLGAQEHKTLDKFNSVGEFIEHLENMYFGSPFTHLGSSDWPYEKTFPYLGKKNMVQAWKYIEKEGVLKLEWLKELKRDEKI